MNCERRRKLRLMLLVHDPHCWFCGKYLTKDTSTIDHLEPRCEGGPDQPHNFRLSCRVCNQAKPDHPIERLVCPLPRGVGVFPLSVLPKDAAVSKATFNYQVVANTTVRKRVREQAKQIHTLLQKSAEAMVEIGQRLEEVKESLGTTHFRVWLKAEFGWNGPIAYNYMQAARKFGDLDFLPNFELAALIKLARKNIPDEAVNEAIDVARAGEQVTSKRAVDIIQQHAPQPTRVDAGRPRQKAAAGTPERKPDVNALDSLRQSLDAFSRNLETIAVGLSRDDREALADWFLQLVMQLKSLPEPKPARKAARTRRPRRKSAAAA